MDSFWKKLLDHLCGALGDQVFDAWIKPISFVGLEGCDLSVEVPDPFFKEWLETHYATTIRAVAGKLTKGSVVLRVSVKKQPPPKQSSKSAPPVPSAPPFSSANISSRYTLENFVVGTSNQFAHAAAKAVASGIGLTINVT